jgi:hypothetical protein
MGHDPNLLQIASTISSAGRPRTTSRRYFCKVAQMDVSSSGIKSSQLVAPLLLN